ncbi:fused MFS/spermidine synthase [Pseudomonas sp. B21-012]|uniref:fused MFS/spermidine synthase n=1 Tax=Pseudomonas sp. B21-012 TaxID=2895472 RepID=UPI00215E32DC|nr:fused MFS/spermidine synthase [Pseudomonas sp. B21-012]UVM57234.1 fused MFS/spermidine synthase [Pseudomonas sp. B21-012]
MPVASTSRRRKAIPVSAAQTLPRVSLAALLLLASGAAALIYQVLWIKQLSLVVGVEVYAITAGISAFFAGLALGGLWLGRRADGLARPLAFYAVLEVAVAVLGIAATFGLSWAAGPFARLENSIGLLAWSLPFALVGIPALLMGGTLPVLVRAVTADVEAVGRAGGQLYAANTAGAIIGTLLGAFVLIPALGIRGSACAAAVLNLLAAAGALWLARGSTPCAPAACVRQPRTGSSYLALTLYAVAGGIALGYEVVWSQAIVQFMSTRTFAFAVVLATYLGGLVLGSALYARRADRIGDPWGAFAVLIAAAGLLALLEIAGLGRWLIALQSQAEATVLALGGSALAGMCARFAVVAVSIVFLPTTLLGAAFPLALRLVSEQGHVGRDVGSVVAFNTLGGIVGVMLCGFVLVPQLGLVRTLGLLAVLAALVALLAVLRGERVASTKRRTVFVLGIASLAMAWLTPAERLAQLLPGARNSELVFYQEGRGGTVAVVEQQKPQGSFRRLYIQGVSNTGDAMPSLRYMRLQALLPLLIHNGEPRSALVIGLGTGITAGALLRYPGLEQRVVAELLPGVVSASALFQGNYNAASDPRLQVRMRDGRRELLGNAQRYDLITLEPPPPSAAGVVNLYSRDFYRLAASRLNTQGLLAQWLPLPTQNDEDSRALVRSFLDVFPYASLWTTEFHEMLLVGSQQPVQLDLASISERLRQPEVQSSLAQVGIDSAASLLATWVTDRDGLERYAGDVAAVTDDQPRIEYAPWVRSDEITRVLPALMALSSPVPIQGADSLFRLQLGEQRQRLQRFYQVGLTAYRGQREAWARQVREVAREDGQNPYFRWFLGLP